MKIYIAVDPAIPYLTETALLNNAQLFSVTYLELILGYLEVFLKFSLRVCDNESLQ